MMYYDLKKIKVLENNKVYVCFEDNRDGIVDLTDTINRGGVFEPLKDRTIFEKAYIDSEWSVLTWPGGVDIAPEFLYNSVAKV